jgi:hypothetical protein
VARRTAAGVLGSLRTRMPALAGASAAQHAAVVRLSGQVTQAYAKALGRVEGAVRAGSVLSGEALVCWRGYPGSGAETLQSALADGLAMVLRTALDGADELVADGWRRDPVGRALLEELGGQSRERLAERVNETILHWRTSLADLAYEEVRFARDGKRPPADPEEVAALLATALLGGRPGSRVGERLADLLGAQTALRMCDRAREELGEAVEDLLRAERDRRLAPLDELDVTPRQQTSLIATFSVVQKAR